MKLQGNVKGSVYPVTQQAYDEPIDATHKCAWCGHRFAAHGRGNHTYCSERCRVLARCEQRKAEYRRRKAR